MNKSSLLFTLGNGEFSFGTTEGLDKIRPKDFNLYLNWLHSGQILTADSGDYEWEVLFRPYVMSYTLCEPGFRHDIVDTIAVTYNSKLRRDENLRAALPYPDDIS